jgi:lactate dehydrogenase-like 2-hydroxyacid dehydrogenase
MANMSYCMFENTYNDLDQCYEALADALDEGSLREFLADMSTEEREAFNRMRSLVNDMVEAYDHVADAAVKYGVDLR